MVEHGESISRIRTSEGLKEFRMSLLASAREDTPQLASVHPTEIDAIVDTLLDLLQKFEHAARPHPAIHADTDVVMIVSGPGEYSQTIEPKEEKLDRYRNFPWARKMDRARVRAGVTLVREVTAKRLEKPEAEVTEEDIANHGPWLHYASTSWENNHIRHALAQPALGMPSSKIFMYTFLDDHGKERQFINTATQMEGLEFPEGSRPRRVLVVSHPPHLVRTAYLMERSKERIPKGTVVQFFPIPTPKEAVEPYGLMELRGVFAAIYKLGTAAKTPFNFSLE